MIPQVKPIITEKEAQAVYQYIKGGGWLTEHDVTREFEEKLRIFLGTTHCSVVPNGTIGLMLALWACGIKSGDKVAVPALTMVATANAVTAIGAIPVLVDVDTEGCMDISTLKEKVNAVIFVSLNGRSSTIDGAIDYCVKNKAVLIEDACQALGSEHFRKCLGTFGHAGVFSFSPHKIITTGQGGAIVTDCKDVRENLKLLRDFGRDKAGSDEYRHFGINAKFTDLQSTIGICQLENIEERIAKKKEIYDEYEKNIGYMMISKPDVPWFVDIYSGDRDGIHDALLSEGFGSRKMYPTLDETCYTASGEYPIAKEISRRGLFLPSSLDITKWQITEICRIIKEYYE